ncbi:uncharacterized protein PGTG_15669 [Puccinia graminis f. sp. tritici CRL 75-36-700-3]|uniref:DUF7872 domain-containing protein n=1 Tax=Puccinia graminis f. sp. tritici (strain CRL 75-36-700-3 / race SCCL) TaxID=418459 RepID=E3KYZ5_PUCGT|nr:uncharacterized protein PGTG_15669 [Puccinia graminis f. sp. tritici CRL 75-36-700-3]EFP89520.2 hypothetical protein PGTG_15669 [Puccinia graminis f. sp. tritici CRL 75-36-700-3]
MLSWFTDHLLKTKSSFSFVILVLLIANQLHAIHSATIPYGRGRLLDNLSNSTNLQSFYNVSSASTRPSHRYLSSHHTSTGIPQKDTDSVLLDECMSRPLSPKLWMEMGMNEFLRDYRNGENLNLLQLANQVNLTNFDCGIEKLCYADQLCQPVRGKEWYILVAAQEWNTFMNAAYQSIGWAMTMMQGVAPSLVHDFYPDLPDTWAIIKAILTFASALAKVIPTEGLLTYPKWCYQLVQGEFGLYAGVSNLMDDIIMKNPVNQHDKWTAFSYALSKSQDRAQMAIANLSQSIIEAGISTENGIYGVLKDGNFLMGRSKTHKKTHEKLDNIAGDKESELKVAVQLHLLAAIWEQQNYFITRGSDPCTGSGPNGAWGGDKVLSYCGPDNVMMNIIQAKGKHAINKVHNAKLVTVKYNFSVKSLTEAAWNCQKQSGKFEFDVWNSTDPVKFDDQCSFNLPVCDLTRPDIREYRDSGAGTVAACRIIGGLPI